MLSGNILRSIARYPPVTALIVYDASKELVTLNRYRFNRSYIALDNLTDVGCFYLGIIGVNITDLYFIICKIGHVTGPARDRPDKLSEIDKAYIRGARTCVSYLRRSQEVCENFNVASLSYVLSASLTCTEQNRNLDL